MDKQITNAPGAETLAQPLSRRDFFKSAAGVTLAGAGAASAAGVFAPSALAQSSSGSGDVAIGNFALTLEYLESTFYNKGVDSGLLSGEFLSYFTAVRDHENEHVKALKGILGSAAVSEPQFTFPQSAFQSETAFAQLALKLETVGVGAYLGAAPMISSDSILEAALTIYGVENEHVAAIQNLLNVSTPPMPFVMPLTKQQVLNAIAPFLGMGQMPNTGGSSGGGPFRAV